MNKEFDTSIKIIRSSRKTVAIQVYPDQSVVVRAPRLVPMREIERIIAEKEAWIKKQLDRVAEEKAEEESATRLTGEEIQILANKAHKYIPERVAYYAPLIGVTVGRITIRNQRTKWGSCSSKGNLNFNCLLMLTPPEVIDYVVVHELCHRKEMNHSKAFWSEVEKILPNYKILRKWLKTEGSRIMRRMG